MDNSSRVVEALKVLQEEGREDLLQQGVLEQAWVGLKRPKRASSEGVAAAVMACESPVRSSKKFRQKSVMGRRFAESVNKAVLLEGDEAADSPQCVASGKRGGTKFAQPAGTSFRQRIAIRVRGAADLGAVAVVGRMGMK
ncbi:hypothetical protein NDU88_001553 [Pleurodeles waltl]|uniref:Uncharacterized protein n=1 Tax=Pleurodeles waltl TaxID=8319 RepID=A0AAV7SB80_PLEWA|nr:hypothetical protein NDU88_001553 [Pleurodeles waltl]